MSSIWRTLERGVLRDIALTCLAVLFIGLSYGAIAVASGFPLWVPAAQSVLVLAGRLGVPVHRDRRGGR